MSMPTEMVREENSVDAESWGIRDVWASNLEEEFRLIREIVKDYSYVAMDTEFPGIVARPLGEFKSREDYQYQLLKCNVDLLKLIQVGLTFMNEKGQLPKPCSTWQFNFKFSVSEDMYAQDSYELLHRSGIQFRKLEDEGVDPEDFAELLITSGVVLDNVTFLSFHSGYDFGYLMKILTSKKLPDEQSEFFDLLKLFFPRLFDIKTVLRYTNSPAANPPRLTGGLQEIADQLTVRRLGPQHQAGSDALLTGMTFFKIKEELFEGRWKSLSGTEGVLYGFGRSAGNGLNGGAAFEHIPEGPGGIIEGRNTVNGPPGLVPPNDSSADADTALIDTAGVMHSSIVNDGILM